MTRDDLRMGNPFQLLVWWEEAHARGADRIRVERDGLVICDLSTAQAEAILQFYGMLVSRTSPAKGDTPNLAKDHTLHASSNLTHGNPDLQRGFRPGGLGAKPPVVPSRCNVPSCGLCAALRAAFRGDGREGGSSNTPLLWPRGSP